MKMNILKKTVAACSVAAFMAVGCVSVAQAGAQRFGVSDPSSADAGHKMKLGDIDMSKSLTFAYVTATGPVTVSCNVTVGRKDAGGVGATGSGLFDASSAIPQLIQWGGGDSGAIECSPTSGDGKGEQVQITSAAGSTKVYGDFNPSTRYLMCIPDATKVGTSGEWKQADKTKPVFTCVARSS